MQPQNLDQITAGLRPQTYDYWKASATGKGVGSYHDFFVNPGFPGGLATIPGIAGSVCDLSTQGALPIGNTPPGKETWLTGVSGVSSVNNGLFLYDRLVHYGGAVGNVTTVQSFGAIALPRYSSGVGVLPYIEWFSSSTGSTQIMNVTYLNTNNVQKTVVVQVPASPAVGQMLPVQLATGDIGCRGVVNVQLQSSTGQSGNFGPVLIKTFPGLGAMAGVGFNLDWLNLGLPKVEDNACLSVMTVLSGTPTGILDLSLHFADV